MIRLSIKGNIIPSFDKIKKKDDLNTGLDNVSFGDVYKSEIPKDTITIVNDNDLPLHVFFERIPKYLGIKIDSNEIPPYSTADVVCTLNTPQVDKFGFFMDKVTTIMFNTAAKSLTKLIVTANILPDLKKNNEVEDNQKPKISFVESIKYLYPSKNDEKMDCEFRFMNLGSGELKIYDIYMNSGCSVKDYSEVVSQGEEGYITIVCDDFESGKNYKKVINVVSNDPVNTQKDLRIIYQFEKENKNE